MRHITVKLGAKSLRLAASFGAAEEISDTVADAFFIVKNILLNAQMEAGGVTSYTPKFEYTAKNIAQILTIAVRHTDGLDLGDDEVRQLIMDAGLIEAAMETQKYISFLVTPSTERKTKDEPKAEPGE